MLGYEIRAIREARGLSRRQVVERAEMEDISVGALRSLESGKTYPNLRTLECLAPILGIRIIITPTETIVERDE